MRMVNSKFCSQGHFSEASKALVRPGLKRKREDSEGRVRSSSKVPRNEVGLRDVAVSIECEGGEPLQYTQTQLHLIEFRFYHRDSHVTPYP